MTLPDGTTTVNDADQLEAISQAWEPIFNKFINGSPSADTFMQHFGHHMRTADMTPRPLTSALLVEQAKEAKPSSCSLDQWRPESLQALAFWYPSVFQELASILQHIETTGVWPATLASGYVSLIPKEDLSACPQPTVFRPVNILSAVYRLWSSCRFKDCLLWQEQWAPPQMWGCRPRRGAEALGLETALQIEEAQSNCNLCAGGISYDFRKAFDLIPESLLFAALSHRGMHNCILVPLQGLYKQLRRVFRLRGTVSPWWRSSNGLVQGCAISMIGLNSLVAVVLEVSAACCPTVIGRAYADDLSGTSVVEHRDTLLNGLKHFDRIVRAFEATGFGEISQKKTHTFGDKCLNKAIHADYGHHKAFRLVGASILSDDVQSNCSTVESSRVSKWAQTVKNMRYAPNPWRDKAKYLLVTQAQATYGQGTHSLGVELDRLKRIRSDVMRCLWSASFYTHNPNLTFAFLVKPQLDPLFAFIYRGLFTVLRCCSSSSFQQTLQNHLRTPFAVGRDGPANRLKALKLQQPIFASIIDELVAGVHNKDEWGHKLRMIWRNELVYRAARDRPQHFADLAAGCDFQKTLSLYKKWDKELRTNFTEP